jgi:hypothetical protein
MGSCDNSRTSCHAGVGFRIGIDLRESRFDNQSIPAGDYDTDHFHPLSHCHTAFAASDLDTHPARGTHQAFDVHTLSHSNSVIVTLQG